MDLTTALTQLSGFLQNKLQNTNFLSLLSAYSELSAIPFHPYEKIKYDLFGKDYKFQTINDIEQPKDFCLATHTSRLTAISERTKQQTINTVASLSNIDSRTLENTMYVDPEILKRNIEFVEVVKTIDINDIQTKPIELMQKLTSFYIQKCG